MKICLDCTTDISKLHPNAKRCANCAREHHRLARVRNAQRRYQRIKDTADFRKRHTAWKRQYRQHKKESKE